MITEFHGWKDSKGVLHDDELEAIEADTRIRLQNCLSDPNTVDEIVAKALGIQSILEPLVTFLEKQPKTMVTGACDAQRS